MEVDASDVVRAAELSKCDLITDLVGEFPDLQGTMGRYYAQLDGESDAVADAIGEQYHPRFAGDDAAGQPGRTNSRYGGPPRYPGRHICDWQEALRQS